MKTLKQSKHTAKKALHLYEIGEIEAARKLAKRVSWRTLFIGAYTREAANGASQWIFSNSVNITDRLKGIANDA